MPANGLLFGTFGAVSTPDTASLKVTGDIDVRVKLSAPDWTPSAGRVFARKYTSTTGEKSWIFAITSASTGLLTWQFFRSSGETVVVLSTEPVPFSDGATGWCRATWDANNGASGNTTTFYTSTDSTDDPAAVSWSQLGDPVVNTPQTAIFDSNEPITLGLTSASGAVFYVFELRNGIGGTVVAHVNFKTDPVISDSVTDKYGLVWTPSNATFQDFVSPASVMV